MVLVLWPAWGRKDHANVQPGNSHPCVWENKEKKDRNDDAVNKETLQLRKECIFCCWGQQKPTHRAQHQDGAEWIQSYGEGRWGSIHACREWHREETKIIFIINHSFIAGNKSSHHAFNWAQMKQALTWRRVQSCSQGSHFHVCLCPLSHNALLHGSPSAPLSARNLAVM